MIRLLALFAALLVAAPAAAHQDTVAHSRMVIRESGDVEYALKIPVEDLAETLGRTGHAALDAPEVRAAEEPLFRHFEPLVSMASGGVPCLVERAGIDVPEDERLHGELRFLFHCRPGAPVTLDYRVFFDVDPGHMGMLEVESSGGKARAELISERPRWEIDASREGPPQVRHVYGAAAPPAENPGFVAASSTAAEPAMDIESTKGLERAAEPDAHATSSVARSPKASRPTGRSWVLIAVAGGAAVAAVFFAARAARRRTERSR